LTRFSFWQTGQWASRRTHWSLVDAYARVRQCPL